MNRIERLVISHLVARYMKQIQKEDLMLDHILPLIKKLTDKDSNIIVKEMKNLLYDWIDEIDKFKERNKR